MMRSLLLSFIFINSFTIFAQDNWIQKDFVNGPPRSSCASFVLDGEGFVLGGLGVTSFKRKLYSYDVDQDDWDNEESLGGENGDGLERGGAIGFTIKGKGYVGLGQGNSVAYFSDFWEYNPDTKAWTQKADFIGSARRQAIGFSIDSTGYVGTGQDQNGLTKDFYKYDNFSNTWTQLSDFAGAARKGAVGFSEGGQGYVATGDTGTYCNDFWMYSPQDGVWSQKPDFPGTPRTGAVGWGTFPNMYIACGFDNTLNYKKDVWEYNFFGNQWVQRADFIGSARTNATAFSINGIGYLGLGYDGDFKDDFYAYTPILSNEQYEENIDITLFPNPCSEKITISGALEVEGYSLTIYDIKGQICQQTTLSSGTNSILLNREQMPAGIYICRISNHTDTIQKKIIIQ